MYTFVKDGKLVTLVPLTPQQVYDVQMKLKGQVDQKNKSGVEIQEKKEREQKSESEAENKMSDRDISKETTKPPKEIDEATSDNIGRLLHDNGVVGSKDDCDNVVMEFKGECDNGVVESKDEFDSEVLPDMKDDSVKYPVDGESLIARPALQIQIKTETFDQQFELGVQEMTRKEEVQQMLLLELEDESSKKMSRRSNQDEANELLIYQVKANEGCRFIFDPGDWLWMHVTDLYPFDSGSDSRSNPFEEEEDDAIHASHGPLLHWIQAMDHIGLITKANRRLDDQNKRETKFGSQKRKKPKDITMRSHGYTTLQSQGWTFTRRT
ncbi:Retrotrans gag domain-containing protein [Abeliophyllum distichum]|uniref:Retrotrans gag domain-containing protein n=1 Tax=Abeliophyllum distichum TaxID=126358 RepID=A0ABD1V4Q9_9LAMI